MAAGGRDGSACYIAAASEAGRFGVRAPLERGWRPMVRPTTARPEPRLTRGHSQSPASCRRAGSTRHRLSSLDHRRSSLLEHQPDYRPRTDLLTLSNNNATALTFPRSALTTRTSGLTTDHTGVFCLPARPGHVKKKTDKVMDRERLAARPGLPELKPHARVSSVTAMPQTEVISLQDHPCSVFHATHHVTDENAPRASPIVVREGDGEVGSASFGSASPTIEQITVAGG